MEVTIRAEGGYPVFLQLSAAKLPEAGPQPPSADIIASVLSLNPSDVVSEERAPQAFSCGVPFLLSLARSRCARAGSGEYGNVGNVTSPHIGRPTFTSSPPRVRR